MDKTLAFQILGLPETKEEEPIREHYLTLLKDTNPEDDPEGFRRLREAYEEAIRFTREREEQEEAQPETEVDFWMCRVRETYRNIFSRRNPERWKELFEDPVCVGFDTFLEARGNLLGFLSGHSFLPQVVWRLLDQEFHVLEDFEALKEDFHVNFLRHIEYHVNTEDFLDYNLFEESAEGYAPENDEDTDNYIIEFFQIKNKLEEGDTEGVSQALSDLTRHGLYHPYEDVEQLRLFIRMDECEKGHDLAKRLIEQYGNDNNVRIWVGRIFSHTGEEKRAYELWQAVLDQEPDYYIAKYFAMHYLADQEQWYQASEYLEDLIRVNRRDEELLDMRARIGEALLPLLQEAVAEGKSFEDLSGKELLFYLGWRLFDLERYEDAMAFLGEHEETLNGEETYYELKAWTLYKMERYEEAIPVYQAHLKSVETGEDEAEKKASKAAQSHRLLGVCLYCLERPEEGEKETKLAIEMETDGRTRLDCKQYLADRYLAAKEYEKATEMCDEILSEDENYYPAYLVRQESCYHMRRAQQVVDDYYRAIELYAGYDRPYLYAAMIFYNYSQYKDAWGVIERARENQVEFSKRLRFQEAKIRRMLAEDEESRQKAMEMLDALLYETEEGFASAGQEGEGQQRDTLDRADLILEKALVFEDSGKLTDAIALVQEAIKLDEVEPYYHLILGNLLRDSERYQDAFLEYKKVEGRYQHAEFFFGMGVCAQEMERWSAAIYYYTQAIEKDEVYRDTNLRLYRCHEKRYCIEYKRADYEAALKYINKQMEITENPGYRYWDRGFLYNDSLETELALADYEKALPLIAEEDRYIVLQNIGYTYKSDRRFAEGYEAYRRAVECMEPKDASPKGYTGMSECAIKMGDYEKAIACCRQGLAIFPNNEDLWDTLSDCYEETGRFEEAFQVEEERCKQMGATAAYYSHVSFLMLKTGRDKEVSELFRKAKTLFLQRSADKDELADLYEKWAYRLAEQQKNKEAVKLYQDAAALYRDNWDKFDCECSLTKNYYMMGEYEHAERHAKRAFACIKKRNTTPEDYITYFGYIPIRLGWMGWLYLATGEKEKAKLFFQEMEKAHPCASCRYKGCYEASLWLGYYYYCEKEYDKAAALMEETLRRDFDALEAKYLLQKIQAEQKKGKGFLKGLRK